MAAWPPPRRSVHDLLDAGLGNREDQRRRVSAPAQHPRHRASGGRPENSRRASSGSPASTSSTVTTSTRATTVAMLPTQTRQAAQATHAAAAANASDRPTQAHQQRFPRDQPHPTSSPAAGEPGRHLAPPRPTAPRPISPLAARRSAPRRPAQPARRRGTRRRARAPRPGCPPGQARGGRRPRRGGQPAAGQPVPVPPGPTRGRLVLPARLDRRSASQIDRVQRARLQPRVPGQRVPMLPLRTARRTAPPSPTASTAQTQNVTPRQRICTIR